MLTIKTSHGNSGVVPRSGGEVILNAIKRQIRARPRCAASEGVSEIVKKIQADSDTKKRFDASNLTAPTSV